MFLARICSFLKSLGKWERSFTEPQGLPSHSLWLMVPCLVLYCKVLGVIFGRGRPKLFGISGVWIGSLGLLDGCGKKFWEFLWLSYLIMCKISNISHPFFMDLNYDSIDFSCPYISPMSGCLILLTDITMVIHNFVRGNKQRSE